MNELKKKTMLTIFTIFTSILFISFVILNVTFYHRERTNIERTVTFMNNANFMNRNIRPEDSNMVFMDYEVYTAIIDKNSVSIINNGFNNNDFDALEVAVDVW